MIENCFSFFQKKENIRLFKMMNLFVRDSAEKMVFSMISFSNRILNYAQIKV